MNIYGKLTSPLLIVSLTLPMLFLPAASAAPVTSYRDATLSETNTIPAIKPLWSVETEQVGQAFPATGSGNNVIYVHKNKLRAVNAATGKTHWSSSFLPSSELIKGNGTLYFIDQKGTLVSLNAKTGKTAWKTNTGMPASNASFTIQLVGGTLYAGGPLAFQAYDPVNGKRLWKQKTESEYGGPTIQGLYNGVLVASMTVSGALTIDQYSAYNPKTGKKLWESGGNNGPVLASRNGYLYVRDQYPMSSPDHALVLNIYEGKGDFLAGPYLNRFFVQKDLQFQSVPLNGKTSESYDIPPNPVSRLDLIENNAYVGISDGKFYMIDIPSGKTLGVVGTGARVYEQTLVIGNAIVVQTEDRLIAVTQPLINKKR